MERVLIRGKMEGNMKDNTFKTLSMVMERTAGQMEQDIKVLSSTEKDMGEGDTL